MGNPIESLVEEPHVHFSPVPTHAVPEITLTEPEGIFTMSLSESESETESETSDDESIESLEYGDWISNVYRLRFLQIFRRSPECVQNAIGKYRVLELFDSITSTINRVPAICSDDKSTEITDLLLSFDDEDRSLLVDRDNALVWMKILLNHTTNTLLVEEHDEMHSHWSYNVNLRSVVYEQLTYLSFSSTERAYKVSPPTRQSMLSLMEYRAGVSEVTRRSIICYRLMMNSGARGVTSLAESRFVTRMSWFRDHACFMAVGAVLTGIVSPIPNLPFGHTPYTPHRPVEQTGPEDIVALFGDGQEEQGVRDYILNALRTGAVELGGAATAGAVEGVVGKLMENPVMAFGAKVADAVGLQSRWLWDFW